MTRAKQQEMFPMTEAERVALLRVKLTEEVDRRQAKRDAAASDLVEAEEALNTAQGLLDAFDHMVARAAHVDPVPAEPDA